ncbi:MAG: hypothetical protein ACW9W3_07820 [Candidatus Nitrosopumilus sp. bin_68KS]
MEKIKLKNKWLGAPLVALLFVSVFSTAAHAEDTKDVYNQAKLAAELEFSETIQKAKEELKTITEKSPKDPELKKQAEKNYYKIVADAKIIRDQKIAQAWEIYQQASTTKITDPKQAREAYTKTINDAKIKYEKQLEDARTAHEISLSETTDEQNIKALEKKYEQTQNEIKEAYNNAITKANEEYQKAKEDLKKSKNNSR